ncbi:MAG TPA: DUF3553 domain-containing protein [Stellaceae bacterium]
MLIWPPSPVRRPPGLPGPPPSPIYGRQGAPNTTDDGPIMRHSLVPGVRVRHPSEPGWGVGQVQSAVGDRVTVNFENAGKMLINIVLVALIPIADEPPPRR